MTLSSSLSLFRRFSRKNKRQPSEPAVQVQFDDVTPLPHGELSSSEINVTRANTDTAGRDQHDKGERKRSAERVQGDDDASSSRKWTRKVAFNEQQPVDRSLSEPIDHNPSVVSP